MSIGVKETMLIVGGTFDDNGGKLSSVVNQIMAAMLDESFDVKLYNGGSFDQVESILEECKYLDYILWLANVPNDKPKLRNVKEINPKAMLVTSKRNDDNKYSFAELINRALGAKANLCVQFSKVNDMFTMMLFDPLGNSLFYVLLRPYHSRDAGWYQGGDPVEYRLRGRCHFQGFC